jgi:hypothetical protein
MVLAIASMQEAVLKFLSAEGRFHVLRCFE